MGYSTTFRLKGELDNQFKPIRQQKSYTLFSSTPEEYECVLVAIVMKSGIENSKIDVSEIHNIYKNIKMELSSYITYLIDDWKYNTEKILKADNNEITFYGWNYSDVDRDFTWESREDIINSFTRSLFEIAIEPVPSRFESDDSSYSDKIERAYETVSELQDTVTSFMTTEFIKRYRDSDDAWESDGYRHLFPEEVEEEDEEKAEVVEEHTAEVADEEKYVDVTEDILEKKEEKVDVAEYVPEYTPEKVERKEDTDGRIFYQKL